MSWDLVIRGRGNHVFNEFNTCMLHMSTKELLTADSSFKTPSLSDDPSVGMKNMCSKQSNHARAHTDNLNVQKKKKKRLFV